MTSYKACLLAKRSDSGNKVPLESLKKAAGSKLVVLAERLTTESVKSPKALHSLAHGPSSAKRLLDKAAVTV